MSLFNLESTKLSGAIAFWEFGCFFKQLKMYGYGDYQKKQNVKFRTKFIGQLFKLIHKWIDFNSILFTLTSFTSVHSIIS